MLPARSWKTPNEPRFLVLYCGLVGLIIPLWMIKTYVAQDDPRAIAIIVLIVIGFVFGIYELWRQANDIDTLQEELQAMDLTQPPEEQLHHLSPALNRIMCARLYGGMPDSIFRATYTPYLLGALILLGLIGTFIGLVDTLSGTRAALQITADLETLRSSLLTPITGLALAFGTSLSGVATSVVLGLAATLTRRQESRLHHRVSNLASSSLAPLHPLLRQTVALETLVKQGAAFPSVVERYHETATALIGVQDEIRKGQELIAHHVANTISERAEAIRADLGVGIKRFSDEVEPLLKGILVHATALLDDTGKDLLTKVQERFDIGAQRDQERRSELLKLFEFERQVRSSQETQHFENLAGHAKELTDALQTHVEVVGKQYSIYLAKLEQQLADLDQAWRNDVKSRYKDSEAQRKALDSHLESIRDKFSEQSEAVAKRHQELLERINQQYQDLVERFSKQTGALADQAAKSLSELTAKYAASVDRLEQDRDQLRKAWGIEQGRQQRQFDALLDQMRADLEERRRADAEEIGKLNSWAHRLITRVEFDVVDKAANWDTQFNKLIAALAETAETMRVGERARLKDFKELVQIISDADKHRSEELRRAVTTLRESNQEKRPRRSL